MSLIAEFLKLYIQRKRERLGQWWEDSPWRKCINDNPVSVVKITIACVLLLLVVIVWLSWPEQTPQVVEHKKEWFYDLNTDKLFTAQKGLTPPIEAPSGPLPDGEPAGVRAYVLTYVDEPNEAERFIAFLEIAAPGDPNDVPGKPAPRLKPTMRWGKGKLIRRLEDEEWVPGDSRRGQAIFREAFAPGQNGRRPSYYQPE